MKLAKYFVDERAKEPHYLEVEQRGNAPADQPAWCCETTLKINGKIVGLADITKKGYARIKREWAKGDKVELVLDMPVERIAANPKVRQNCGRVTLQRGPLVYCLEQADNGKGLNNIILPQDAKLTAKMDRNLFGGVITITAKARRLDDADWKQELYQLAGKSKWKTTTLKAIPYYLWANRNHGEMLVWIRQN